MKKTLLTATLIMALSATSLAAEAFCWRNLNPANWGTCPPCEKTASCKCKKDKCVPPCKKEEKNYLLSYKKFLSDREAKM